MIQSETAVDDGQIKRPSGRRQRGFGLAASCVSALPFHHSWVSLLGRKYSLRCVLFHDINEHVNAFTEGLHITHPTSDFERRIRYLKRFYHPVTLEQVADSVRGAGSLPDRPVLITFDDAYRSVYLNAAPILKKYGVPAVLFLNTAFLDNRRLFIDNLICYLANTQGMEPIVEAASQIAPDRCRQCSSILSTIHNFVSKLSIEQVQHLHAELCRAGSIDEAALARQASLYLSAGEVTDLTRNQFEIGNHTTSHVRCRALTDASFEAEINANRDRISAITGRPVPGFSVPYGSQEDLSLDFLQRLRQGGHEVSFLTVGLPNQGTTHPGLFYRTTVCAREDADFFWELEVFPRIKALIQRIKNPGSRRKGAGNHG